jgi:predicted nuclease of predicted toxin-antitoxin system
VKFLVDVNLPPRLARWLSSRGHEAKHLVDLDLLTATDTEYGIEERTKRKLSSAKITIFMIAP